jgi:putative spermidine/putrescine transport system substrate-binding protein
MLTITGRLIAVSAAAIALAGIANAEELRIVSWGGAVNDAYRASMWEPYTKQSGVKVVEDVYSGEFGKIKSQVEAGNLQWDVADPEWPEVEQGCREGLFEKIDVAQFDSKDLIKGAVSECGVMTILGGTVLAYNSEKISDPPKSWADFWDVKKYPGKRGMRRAITDTLPMALMADGVPNAEIYKVLATKEGQDRAFKKLDELKQHIVWWTSGTEQIQGLLTGEYDMAMAWNGRVTTANKEEGAKLAIAWGAGQVLNGDRWVILKGSPNKRQALDFIKFALRPEQQAEFMRKIPYGQVNQKAYALLSDEEKKNLPTTEEHLKEAVLVDPAFFLEHREALTERFEKWVTE